MITPPGCYACISDDTPENKVYQLYSTVPVDPPKNVQEINKTSTSIMIKWDAVPSNQRNGRILSYKVTWYTLRSLKTNRTKSIAVITPLVKLTSLKMYEKYFITVLATNTEGDGPCSETFVTRTDQDSKLLYLFIRE